MLQLPEVNPRTIRPLAIEQSHRPCGFLSGHAYQDGKLEHRSDYTQEEDLVRGIFGAHGRHETAKVRGVRRTGWERGLRGGAVDVKKNEWGVSWTTAAQDKGEYRKTAEQGSERFIVKQIVAEKVRA